jgi:hypothetical protein
MLLFKNHHTDQKTGGVLFERVTAAPNSALANAYTARGLAICDLDGDGRPDAVVNNIDSAPAILKNVDQYTNHWLSIRLIGDTLKKTPRDAIGSTVFATVGGVTERFDVVSGASYASQSDLCLHVGLGSLTKIEKLQVRWANGDIEDVPVTAVDRAVVIHQGKGIITKPTK